MILTVILGMSRRGRCVTSAGLRTAARGILREDFPAGENAEWRLLADSVVFLLLRRNKFDFESDFTGFGNADCLAERLELPQDMVNGRNRFAKRYAARTH